MAKKKEKRRSLLEKIRGLETETHPQGKRVGLLFQAVAAGEIEVSCVLLFLEILHVACSGLTSVVWKSAVIGGTKGEREGPPLPTTVQFFFHCHTVFWTYPTFAVDAPTPALLENPGSTTAIGFRIWKISSNTFLRSCQLRCWLIKLFVCYTVVHGCFMGEE